MKTSARNQLTGVIEKVVHGPVSAEVVLRISKENTVTGVITNESAQDLGLQKGDTATALIKASSVILMDADEHVRTSAKNRFCGKVDGIVEGMVTDEVTIDLEDGNSIVATITKKSFDDMKLKNGETICALVKASHVILAIKQ
jgi:molybdate transport system regulatory protein